MRQSAALPYAIATFISACLATPRLEIRQGGESGAVASVCRPPVDDPKALPPPCSHIEYIETMCWPKGTEPIHYDGHAQCMCKGSFFEEWAGCQNCLQVHGFRSWQEVAFYSSVLSAASEALCTGTPTAPFRSLFAQAEATLMPVTTGATEKSDQFPGKTDIGLYYTPTGTQGTGEVTGPAATVVLSGGLATAGPETTTGTKSSDVNSRKPGTTMPANNSSMPTGDSRANTTGSTMGLVVLLASMAAFAALS